MGPLSQKRLLLDKDKENQQQHETRWNEIQDWRVGLHTQMNQILQRNERNHNHEKYKQKTGDGKMFKQKLQIETQEVMNMNMNSTSFHDTLNYCGYIQTIHIHVDSANQMRIQTENRKKNLIHFLHAFFCNGRF